MGRALSGSIVTDGNCCYRSLSWERMPSEAAPPPFRPQLTLAT